MRDIDFYNLSDRVSKLERELASLQSKIDKWIEVINKYGQLQETVSK